MSCPLFYLIWKVIERKRECNICSELENHIKCRSEYMSSPISSPSRENSLMNSLSDIFPSLFPSWHICNWLKWLLCHSKVQPFPPMGVEFFVLLSLKCCNNRHFGVTCCPLVKFQMKMRRLLFNKLKLGLVFIVK